MVRSLQDSGAGGTALGAHLVNELAGSPTGIFYWRDRGFEVDHVLSDDRGLTLIEVGVGTKTLQMPGFAAFERMHGKARKLIVGPLRSGVQEFFRRRAGHWTGARSRHAGLRAAHPR